MSFPPRSVPLTLAVVGPVTGGSAPVAAAAARAFERLGHRVSFIDNRTFAPDLAACKTLPEGARQAEEVRVFHQAAAHTQKQLRERRPQLALFLAQAPVLSPDDLAPLAERDVPTVFWFVEDYRIFSYWRQAAPRFDHVWTLQQEPFTTALLNLGVRYVDWVPLACEPGPLVEAPIDACGDVTFVGTGYPNRVAHLAALQVPGLRLFGPHFAAEPSLRPFVAHDGTLPHEGLADLFRGSRINLNLSSEVDPRRFGSRKDLVNPRAFEICGAGGFQLADRLIPLEDFFEPGQEVVTFGNVEEAREVIARYLRDDLARKRIAAQGHARAVAEHSYEARLGKALSRLLARDGDRVYRAAG